MKKLIKMVSRQITQIDYQAINFIKYFNVRLSLIDSKGILLTVKYNKNRKKKSGGK